MNTVEEAFAAYRRRERWEAFVIQERAAQGLPPAIEDPDVRRALAELLRPQSGRKAR